MKLHPAEAPVLGESIFAPDNPMSLNSPIEMMRGDWLAWADAYRALAERAGLHLMEHGQLASNEVLAFAFLWRQFLELMLKAMVEGLDAPNKEALLSGGHRLTPLWESLQPVFAAQAGWGGSWPHDRRRLEAVILDFDRLDPGSFDFRYPANLKRTATTLKNAPSHINVARLNTWMTWVANELNGIFDFLTGGEGYVVTSG